MKYQMESSRHWRPRRVKRLHNHLRISHANDNHIAENTTNPVERSGNHWRICKACDVECVDGNAGNAYECDALPDRYCASRIDASKCRMRNPDFVLVYSSLRINRAIAFCAADWLPDTHTSIAID